MRGFGRQALYLDLGFHRKSVESKRGALHLIFFDTSPLQVHTHANFCMRMYTAATKDLARTCMQAHAIVCACIHETSVPGRPMSDEGRS